MVLSYDIMDGLAFIINIIIYCFLFNGAISIFDYYKQANISCDTKNENNSSAVRTLRQDETIETNKSVEKGEHHGR